MKGLSQTIGWIIGAVIIFPLGLFLYQKYISLNDGYKYVEVYIQNSEEIKLNLTNSFNGDFKDYFQSYTKRQSTNADHRCSYPFYSSTYKKYFAIQEFSAGINFMSVMTTTKFKDTILAYVNKMEMKDPSYGTKNQPLPIFKIRISEKENLELHVLNINDNRYRYNVGQYLTYFKTKADFEKMFRKEK